VFNGNIIKKPTLFRHAVISGFVEALAGRTVVAQGESPEKDQEFLPDVSHKRIGLSFLTPRSRFEWLHRAVTERIVKNFSSSDEQDEHRTRRTKTLESVQSWLLDNVSLEYLLSDTTYKTLFQLLATQGQTPISERLFFRAYFEDYDPKGNPPLAAWKELNNQLNTAYRPFLEGNEYAIMADNYSVEPPFRSTILLVIEDIIKATRNARCD
jgi:hypothetical protein